MHSPPTHLITETKPFFLIPSWCQPESSALPEHLKGEGERGEQSTRLGERWIHKVVDTYGGNVRSREGDNCVGGGTVLSWLPSDQIGSKIFPARRESGNKKCARGWGNGGTFCTRMPRCCTTWCGEKTGNQTERGNWTALKKVSQKNEVNRKIQLSSLYPTYSPTHSHTHTPKKRSVAEIVILLVVTRLPQTNNTGQDAQSRIGVARLVVLWRKSSGEHSRSGHTHICTYRIGKGR